MREVSDGTSTNCTVVIYRYTQVLVRAHRDSQHRRHEWSELSIANDIVRRKCKRAPSYLSSFPYSLIYDGEDSETHHSFIMSFETSSCRLRLATHNRILSILRKCVNMSEFNIEFINQNYDTVGKVIVICCRTSQKTFFLIKPISGRQRLSSNKGSSTLRLFLTVYLLLAMNLRYRPIEHYLNFIYSKLSSLEY